MTEQEEFEFRLRYEQEAGSPPAAPEAAPPQESRPYVGLDAAKDRLRGVAQVTVAPAAQVMSRALAATEPGFRSWAPSVGEYMKGLPERADMFAQDLRDGGESAANTEGQILGTLPAGGLRVGANALLNRAAQGAVIGGQVTPTNDMGAGGNVTLSAAANAVIPPALARIVSPAANAAVRMLAERGVRLTPGQILGPTAKRVEDAARSIPLVGDAISAAQRRSFASFNEAVINDALAPINGRVQGAGREAVESAQQQVSNAYESLLPRLRVVADGRTIQELQGVQGVAAALPPELQPRFNHIVQTEVLSKFTPQGRMSGETMKGVESNLGQIAKSLSASPDHYQRQMAGGVRELQRILRSTVERSNPQQAGQLQAINQSYARLQRVNDAAARVTSEEGIFTPEAFSGAVKKGDVSRGKRNYAAGNALSQDLSDAARSVMGNRVPDSGTARRLLTGGGLAGGAVMLEPNTLTLGAAASIPYLPIGEQLVRNALLRRPASAPQFANALRNRGGSVVGPLVGGALSGGN